MSCRVSILLTLMLLTVTARAQLTVQQQKTIPGSYTTIAVDNLENIYLISDTNQLKKLSETGDSVAVYNNVKKLGEATLLDVSNPLRILIYYQSFATVVMLDRLLNPVNTIDLRRKNIFNVQAIGLSYDGKVWLYDNMENVLKKINDDGSVLLKTPDFRQLFSETITPHQIIDRNQLVYIYDPAQGIYIFDYYGTYKGKLAITNWQNLRITDKFVFGNDAARFYRYTFSSGKYDEWPIPDVLKNKQQYLFEEGILYTLDTAGLTLYSYRP